MHIPAKSILVTRPVSSALVAKARSKGIQLDGFSFIDTEPIQNIEIQQEIEQVALQFATIVFTSSNAVQAVTDMLDGHVPDWRIYCMGYKTKELVENYFGNNAIAGTGNDATELAHLIIENDAPDELIFFCGNRRRDTLPDILEKNHIPVDEIIVYQTRAIDRKIGKNYDGIIFFSPSAVDSFFTHNKISANTIVFAIGNTTNEAIANYCSNSTVISKLPGKEQLVEQAIGYFSE